MTKRNFISLADALKRCEPAAEPNETSEFSPEHDTWHAIVLTLADWCQSQSDRFNRARWLGYIAGECGPNGGAKAKAKQ